MDTYHFQQKFLKTFFILYTFFKVLYSFFDIKVSWKFLITNINIPALIVLLVEHSNNCRHTVLIHVVYFWGKKQLATLLTLSDHLHCPSLTPNAYVPVQCHPCAYWFFRVDLVKWRHQWIIVCNTCILICTNIFHSYLCESYVSLFFLLHITL